MSVTLIKYPVVSESGKVKNIFAGFDAVEIEYKREDTQIASVTQGVDNNILIDVVGDITGSLNVGEWVYLHSAGSSFTYDGVYQIVSVVFATPNTEITVSGDYIESTTSGYCNYKQNWFLESKLVSPDNNDVKNYPSLLQNDGNPNGEVSVNTSMLVDFLKNDILESSQEVLTARQQCKLMYREVWREDDTAVFILEDQEPIIIIFAAENAEIEEFVNGFELPKMWEGYPTQINLLHSLQNYVGERVSVEFDELDINKNDISTSNSLFKFSGSKYGILQVNFNDNQKVIEDNTRYIRFNALTSNVADYSSADYKSGDYAT